MRSSRILKRFSNRSTPATQKLRYLQPRKNTRMPIISCLGCLNVRVSIPLAAIVMAGCSVPADRIVGMMTAYDENTYYAMTEADEGAIVQIAYTKSNDGMAGGLPLKAELFDRKCKSHAIAVAEDLARRRGQIVGGVNEEEMRSVVISDEVAGRSMCIAEVEVCYCSEIDERIAMVTGA